MFEWVNSSTTMAELIAHGCSINLGEGGFYICLDEGNIYIDHSFGSCGEEASLSDKGWHDITIWAKRVCHLPWFSSKMTIQQLIGARGCAVFFDEHNYIARTHNKLSYYVVVNGQEYHDGDSGEWAVTSSDGFYKVLAELKQ